MCLLISIFSSSVFGFHVTKVEFSENYNNQFQNVESEIISQLAQKTSSEDPVTLKKFSILTSLTNNHIPNGAYPGPISQKCWFSEFEKRALRSGLTGHEYSLYVNDYFNICGKELSKFSSFSILGLYEFSKTRYDFLDNSQIKKIQISFDNGKTLTGFIGLKDLKNPRPWLVVKCGVFCSASPSSSNINFMIHLFDETPFNIVFLANRTGYEYISMNKRLTVGGLLESQDLYSVAEWLKKNSPYKQLVSSMHAVGISLGGASVLFADQVVPNLSEDHKQVKFNSMMAICPVVNLAPTIYNVYSGIKGVFFASKTWELLRALRAFLPEIKDFLDRNEEPSQEEFPSIMLASTSRYGSTEKSSFGKLPELKSEKDVAKFNQYSEFAENVNTPLFVWASEDDDIVDNDINTRRLLKSILSKKSNHLGVVNVPYGNHCAFATAYGFPTASSILRTFVLNNSPEFTALRKDEEFLLEDIKLNLKTGEKIVNYFWSSKLNEKFLSLYIEVANPIDMEICQALAPIETHKVCRKRTEIRLPLALLDKLGRSMPTTQAEAQGLTRWLNSQVKLVNNRDELVIGGALLPSSIKWSSYNTKLDQKIDQKNDQKNEGGQVSQEL